MHVEQLICILIHQRVLVLPSAKPVAPYLEGAVCAILPDVEKSALIRPRDPASRGLEPIAQGGATATEVLQQDVIRLVAAAVESVREQRAARRCDHLRDGALRLLGLGQGECDGVHVEYALLRAPAARPAQVLLERRPLERARVVLVAVRLRILGRAQMAPGTPRARRQWEGRLPPALASSAQLEQTRDARAREREDWVVCVCVEEGGGTVRLGPARRSDCGGCGRQHTAGEGYESSFSLT